MSGPAFLPEATVTLPARGLVVLSHRGVVPLCDSESKLLVPLCPALSLVHERMRASDDWIVCVHWQWLTWTRTGLYTVPGGPDIIFLPLLIQ